MKNKLIDLNNHLFLQIERLQDEDLTNEKLTLEVERGKAINDIAKTVVDNARLMLQAQKLKDDGMVVGVPTVIGIE